MSKITNDVGLNPLWHRMLYSCRQWAPKGWWTTRPSRRSRVSQRCSAADMLYNTSIWYDML